MTELGWFFYKWFLFIFYEVSIAATLWAMFFGLVMVYSLLFANGLVFVLSMDLDFP